MPLNAFILIHVPWVVQITSAVKLGNAEVVTLFVMETLIKTVLKMMSGLLVLVSSVFAMEKSAIFLNNYFLMQSKIVTREKTYVSLVKIPT